MLSPTQRLGLSQRLARHRDFRALSELPRAEGRLTRLVGLTLEAAGLNLPVGQTCSISGGSGASVTAEVVGFSGASTFLMPVTPPHGLAPGARVRPVASGARLLLGPACLGRIFDGLGRPLDGAPPPAEGTPLGVTGAPINPLTRRPIERPLDVGIRAINALLTVGEGQRLGLFAGTGVGKSVLLGMMTRNTVADVVVVGLIGERGREVQEFIQHSLGPEGLARSVVVAAPADDAPLMRLRAAELATQIAEFYRDQGAKVLLLMDSLTRFGQAQRELALAIGEPPATRGYPPSVFAKIPALVERAGNGAKGQGSITAFYTVLTEGDDLQDPIADAARGILDGHIVLSRALAEEGVYPAIEVESSVSRVMPQITDAGQRALALEFKQLLSRYRANRDFISIGAYKTGTDPAIDRAVERHPQLMKFLCQGMADKAPFAASLDALTKVLKPKA